MGAFGFAYAVARWRGLCFMLLCFTGAYAPAYMPSPLPGLDFVHGDAEDPPFSDESFDAVLNVEASHAYPRFDRFRAFDLHGLEPRLGPMAG